MPTLAEVKAQIKALPHKYIFYTKREINYLPQILSNDEQIVALTSGFHGNTTVLLVCTNRRLLFIDKGMFFGLKVKQLNLDRIQSLDSSYVILFGSIRIWDGAAAYEIGMILKDSIDPFIRATRDAIENYRRIVFRDVTMPQQGYPPTTPYAPQGVSKSAPPTHAPPPPPQPMMTRPVPERGPAGPAHSSGGYVTNNDAPDMLSQLERLAKLREDGHLSEEEFQIQKKKLLGG